jgi:hypothetical protein
MAIFALFPSVLNAKPLADYGTLKPAAAKAQRLLTILLQLSMQR